MKGKKIVVTGASRGIGADIARIFMKAGGEVYGTRTSVVSKNSSCQNWLKADFSDIRQIYKCAEDIKKIAPDVLINCAGINKIGPFAKVSPEDFLKIQQVNVVAPFILCQAVIPSMQLKKWGRIVNISSIWSKIGKEYRAPYMASKFALDGVTLAVAAEHAQDGILANCVAPGFTDTDLTRNTLGNVGIEKLIQFIPAKRMAQPKEIAEFVYWLASNNNTYISGQNIAIDGGFSRV